MQYIDQKVDELSKELAVIETEVLTEGYTLSKAIREGSSVTTQAIGSYGDGLTACALTASYIAAKTRGVL